MPWVVHPNGCDVLTLVPHARLVHVRGFAAGAAGGRQYSALAADLALPQSSLVGDTAAARAAASGAAGGPGGAGGACGIDADAGGAVLAGAVGVLPLLAIVPFPVTASSRPATFAADHHGDASGSSVVSFMQACEACFPSTAVKRGVRQASTSSSSSDSESDGEEVGTDELQATGKRPRVCASPDGDVASRDSSDVLNQPKSAGAAWALRSGLPALPLVARSLTELAHAVPLSRATVGELAAHYGPSGFGFALFDVVPSLNSASGPSSRHCKGLVGGYGGWRGGKASARLAGGAGGGPTAGEVVVGSLAYCMCHDALDSGRWLFLSTRQPCLRAGAAVDEDRRSAADKLPSTDIAAAVAAIHPDGASMPTRSASGAGGDPVPPSQVTLPVGEAVADLCEESPHAFDHTVYCLGGHRRPDWGGAGKTPKIMTDEMRRRFASGSLNHIVAPRVRVDAALARAPVPDGESPLLDQLVGSRDDAITARDRVDPRAGTNSSKGGLLAGVRDLFGRRSAGDAVVSAAGASLAVAPIRRTEIRRRRIVAHAPNHDLCLATEAAADSE